MVITLIKCLSKIPAPLGQEIIIAGKIYAAPISN